MFIVPVPSPPVCFKVKLVSHLNPLNNPFSLAKTGSDLPDIGSDIRLLWKPDTGYPGGYPVGHIEVLVIFYLPKQKYFCALSTKSCSVLHNTGIHLYI